MPMKGGTLKSRDCPTAVTAPACFAAIWHLIICLYVLQFHEVSGLQFVSDKLSTVKTMQSHKKPAKHSKY